VEPVGTNCTNGGTKIETGLDANGNGVLDMSEVNASQTQYVCNGTSSSSSSSQGVKIGFSSSTTWTCPAGVTQITIELWGGGGGGPRCWKSTETNCSLSGLSQIWIGGSGGKGGYTKGQLIVVPGQTYNINIGSGGAPGTVNPSTPCQPGWGTKMMGGGPGQNGGSSTFGVTLLTAQGGTGGTAASSTSNGINGIDGQIVNFNHSVQTSPSGRSYLPSSYLALPPTCCSSNGTTGDLSSSNAYEAGTSLHQPTAGENGYCVISY
jgi:hypothetical protein